jgi:hypothetical protein
MACMFATLQYNVASIDTPREKDYVVFCLRSQIILRASPFSQTIITVGAVFLPGTVYLLVLVHHRVGA